MRCVSAKYRVPSRVHAAFFCFTSHGGDIFYEIYRMKTIQIRVFFIAARSVLAVSVVPESRALTLGVAGLRRAIS
jgi:hypothetical protein